MSRVTTGLSELRNHPTLGSHWGQVGLLCNQASVDTDYAPAWKILQNKFGSRLTTLFGPQHGFEATVQDNMIETKHAKHAPSGLPVYSLYSETRRPPKYMLENVDTLVIDLQVTGCRVYTFKWSVAECLRACKEYGKKVVILDRPNPVQGNVLEGRFLDQDMYSFVGQSPIPMRHGLTMGEFAAWANAEIRADLEIVSLKGWDPEKDYRHTGLPWVITSPNLPNLDGVFTFPGTVMFEGTNVSEGRGTGLPFQFIGAPYIKDGHEVRDYLTSRWPEVCAGAVLRPCGFQPTSSKWAGESCGGIQIHVTEPEKMRSYGLSLALLKTFIELSEGQFKWKAPGYEYNFEALPIDLILGSKHAHDKIIASNFSPNDSFWYEGIDDYRKKVGPYLIYPRTMEIR